MNHTVCDGNHTHLIARDGGLRHIANPALITELQLQGWRIVVNPKRNYYPEFDATSPAYREENTDPNEETNLLDVEVL